MISCLSPAVVLLTPQTRWKREKTNKTSPLSPAGMSEAVFKIRNVVFRLVSRWKQTWWKSSLFYFAESNSGLGFRTKSIIGTECYLISPQMLFSLPHRLYSTFALPRTDARRTPRYCCLLHGSIPDLEGWMVKRMALILNSKSLYEAINNTAWLANIFLLCQYIQQFLPEVSTEWTVLGAEQYFPNPQGQSF